LPRRYRLKGVGIVPSPWFKIPMAATDQHSEIKLRAGAEDAGADLEGTGDAPAPPVSVVVPVLNEAENIRSLIDEIAAALEPHESYEIVFVDDGSTDATEERLREAAVERRQLRCVRHRRRAGQSAAIASGVKAARGSIIVTLDGDGQNDPADIPKLLDVIRQDRDPVRLLVTGLRAKRRDSWVKRVSSRVANSVRSRLLKDATPDTGCGLKVFMREAFLDMPRFDHMHRFLPALMVRQGGRVVSVPVHHRPRQRGRSNYGTFDRLWVGLIDLAGVMWLQRRARLTAIEPDR
jgi:dolichol-phosphate mannosyltransferase